MFFKKNAEVVWEFNEAVESAFLIADWNTFCFRYMGWDI